MKKNTTKTNRIRNIFKPMFVLMLAVAAVCTISVSGLNTNAASKVVPDPYTHVFDAAYYANRYADLQAVFGTNEAALFNHFVTCGMAEGRQGSAEFDVNYYRTAYPDLQAAFGDNLVAYYNHYMTCGVIEGRKGAGTAPVAAPAQNTTVQNTNTATNTNGGARTYVFSSNVRMEERKFYSDILDSILTPGMSDMEVAKAIHDYLCRTYHYAQPGETVTTLSDIYMNRIGMQLDGYGMYANADMANSTAFECDSYALAFTTLMNAAGVPTATMNGRSARGIGHDWNCTYINGQFLFTDVTYDDSLNTTRYFMITEDQMMQDHLPDTTGNYAYLLNYFKSSVGQ